MTADGSPPPIAHEMPAFARVGDDVRIVLRRYDATHFEEREVRLDELDRMPDEVRPGRVLWIAADGSGCRQLAERWGLVFGIHQLLVEDLAEAERRPALSVETDNHLGLTFKVLRRTNGDIVSEHTAVVIGKGYVLSLHHGDTDPFGAAVARITGGRGRTRRAGPDRLAHALVDAAVEDYFGVLDVLENRADEIEEAVEHGSDPASLAGLHRLRSGLLRIRRDVAPLRDALASLQRNDSPLVTDATRGFFADVHGHVLQVMESTESLRDLVGSVRDLYLTKLDSRLNETMKVLTVIATIFMPMSFLAALYGMNFEGMPELKQPWGYPAVLAVMAACAVGMLVFFRRKRWI